jgi:uncharacterized metal-binding protein YceD (DUF177 family)
MSSHPKRGNPAVPDSVREVHEALQVDLEWLRRQPGQATERVINLSKEWINTVCADTEARAGEAAELAASFSLHSDGTLLLRGRLRGGIVVPCGRCLGDAVVDAGEEMCLTFLPAARIRDYMKKAPGDEADGVELVASDLDEIFYEGDAVDLSDVVREQLLLAFPMRVLCALGEACRGMCGRCGAMVNDMPADATNCSACKAPFMEDEADGEDREDEIPEWKRKLMGLSEGS